MDHDTLISNILEKYGVSDHEVWENGLDNRKDPEDFEVDIQDFVSERKKALDKMARREAYEDHLEAEYDKRRE